MSGYPLLIYVSNSGNLHFLDKTEKSLFAPDFLVCVMAANRNSVSAEFSTDLESAAFYFACFGGGERFESFGGNIN